MGIIVVKAQENAELFHHAYQSSTTSVGAMQIICVKQIFETKFISMAK